jgi:hypothetical protein
LQRTNNLLDRLAACRPESERSINDRVDSASIEEEIRTNNLRPEQLKKQAREMRGWFAYFARRENFERYCAAVRRAEPVFRATCPWPAGKAVAVLVHFRPMHGMYRVRGYSDTILVDLPTPTICFDQDTLRAVAQIAFKKGGDRKAVHDAAAGEAAEDRATIERFGGRGTGTRPPPRYANPDRVNAGYFGRAGLVSPGLEPNRRSQVGPLRSHDTVGNSGADRETVPGSRLTTSSRGPAPATGITWKNPIAAHTANSQERAAVQRIRPSQGGLEKAGFREVNVL